MPWLSEIAQRKKVEFFFQDVPKNARILEVGCGSGWVRPALQARGYTNYTGMDLFPPADIVGDIRKWRELGLTPASFDVVVAFEVVEHVDCFEAVYDLLAPGGRMLITTPLPHRDWVMKCLEAVGLNQKRTSPHDHLVYLDRVPQFPQKSVKIVAGLSQWGLFTKPV